MILMFLILGIENIQVIFENAIRAHSSLRIVKKANSRFHFVFIIYITRNASDSYNISYQKETTIININDNLLTFKNSVNISFFKT